jgi:phycoerythrin-associated linker protein
MEITQFAEFSAKRRLVQTDNFLDLSEKSEQKASANSQMLPPVARKKMQTWIRSRHLICSGHFFIFETVEYSAVERFEECVLSLGGTLISVESVKRVWMGNHRQVILYRAKASLLSTNRDLQQYWFKYGGLSTRYDERP